MIDTSVLTGQAMFPTYSLNVPSALVDYKSIASLQLGELNHEGGVPVKKMNTTTKRTDVSKIDHLATDPIEEQRREKVKDAMIHAWSSYEKYAWGHDELQVCYRFLQIVSLFIVVANIA